MKHKDKKGQTAIELAMVLFVFIAMLSVTYNAVVAFSVHQYMAYAAFMSARALQSSHNSPLEQRQSAVQSLRNYLPQLDPNSLKADSLMDHTGKAALAQNISVSIQPGVNPESGLPQEDVKGVQINFQVPFIRLPLGEEFRGNLEFLNMR